MKEITMINPNGIDYIDEEGTPQFLEFETCYQNFLIDERKRKGSEYVDQHKEHYNKWKCVGFRYAFGNPPLLWFYTVPPTEFEFPTSEKLGEVEYRIRKAGYRTIDGE